MRGLPECPQLVEHQGAEAGLRIPEQLPQRIQLLLNPDGGAFLLLEAVAQQVELILEIRIGLLEARAILEELHEPLFLGADPAAVRAFEKTQLVDQGPAS